MATDKIKVEIQSLSPSAIIELFVLDFTNLDNPGLFHFHAGTNELETNVFWQGQEYIAMPIEADGFDTNTSGTQARPKIRAANINGWLSAEVLINEDLVGCKVIRKRTMTKFLDARNFPGGVNPSADANQYFPDDTWYVDQKVSENKFMIEWELSSPLDLSGVMIPYRQVIQNSCPWKYKGTECGYSGTKYFKQDNTPATSSSEDVCGKTLKSCMVRHPKTIVPFGGFPGAFRYD